MTYADLFPYAKPLPRNHVYVTTQLDIVCPSRVLIQKVPYRCERGVGHEGFCRFQRFKWVMSDDERRASEKQLDLIIREQERQ